MTYEKQDILEDFYSGNSKTVRVTIKDADGNPEPLDGAELTYYLCARETLDVILVKSSNKGIAEIKIIGDGTSGVCEIYYIAADTRHIYGTFRHYLSMVNADGKESTPFTGMVKIHAVPGGRYRNLSGQAYLEGITE